MPLLNLATVEALRHPRRVLAPDEAQTLLQPGFDGTAHALRLQGAELAEKRYGTLMLEIATGRHRQELDALSRRGRVVQKRRKDAQASARRGVTPQLRPAETQRLRLARALEAARIRAAKDRKLPYPEKAHAPEYDGSEPLKAVAWSILAANTTPLPGATLVAETAFKKPTKDWANEIEYRGTPGRGG